jgi:aspartyl/asparaginyl-tRNA synthetase
VFLDKTLRLTFTEAIQLLKESGSKDDDGSELSEEGDLSTAAERELGRLVKEKYGTDYFILGGSPALPGPT